MITKDDFLKIDREVQEAVRECFQSAQQNEKRPNEFICFLANAEYYDEIQPWWSPYSIDYQMDKEKDEDRVDFYMEFIQHRYGFEKSEFTDNDSKMLSIELMIYTHIWESKPFLKMLKRLAALSSSNDYPWKVAVPKFTKWEFICKKIRDAFSRSRLGIAQVMTKGFHSSLRNAFAHSEYSFRFKPDFIYLFNYEGKKDELQEISYDDWSIRFSYSFLLNYHVYNTFHELRQSVNEIYKTTEYVIPQPDEKGGYRDVVISYLPDEDMFQFE